MFRMSGFLSTFLLLMLNDQTLILSSSIRNTDTKPSNQPTETQGILKWLPDLCLRKPYNYLFGENGVVTGVVSNFMGGGWKKEQKVYCCIPKENLPESASSTAAADPSSTKMDVREVPKSKENSTDKKLVNGVKNAGMIVGCIPCYCGMFIKDACKGFAGVIGGFLYAITSCCR